jgi:hypothetical protein
MSVRTQTDRAVTMLASLLFLPGRLVEEGLHILGAFAWAEELSVHIDPDGGTAHTRVQFRDGTPRWAIRLAYALPELVAVVSGVAVIAWWLVGGAVWLPSTTLDWILLSLFGAQYLAIALPSSADMDQRAEGRR